jgi:hypothetical protein
MLLGFAALKSFGLGAFAPEAMAADAAEGEFGADEFNEKASRKRRCTRWRLLCSSGF